MLMDLFWALMSMLMDLFCDTGFDVDGFVFDFKSMSMDAFTDVEVDVDCFCVVLGSDVMSSFFFRHIFCRMLS